MEVYEIPSLAVSLESTRVLSQVESVYILIFVFENMNIVFKLLIKKSIFF